MKKITLAVALLAMFAAGAQAKNFAVPTNDPAATITLPDAWKPDETEYGYAAKSPDDEVYFSIEFASSGKRLDAMLAANDAWLKDNDLKTPTAPKEMDWSFNGLKGKVYRYEAKDADDDETLVDFVVIGANKGRVILLTLWASEEERESHKAEINAIMNSLKPID
jgi:hypothetical protein